MKVHNNPETGECFISFSCSSELEKTVEIIEKFDHDTLSKMIEAMEWWNENPQAKVWKATVVRPDKWCCQLEENTPPTYRDTPWAAMLAMKYARQEYI